MRTGQTERKTTETDVKISISLDGTGKGEISTGLGFFDHMLNLFAAHGGFDLCVSCEGDTFVDGHHSVEDTGIALGIAFKEALGSRAGIRRYGSIILPMDEALILAAADISGRGMLCFTADFKTEKIGNFDTELVEEFFTAFASNAGITLHLKQLDGRNSHHIAEGFFKASARALRAAVEIDEKRPNEIPSTKGTLL